MQISCGVAHQYQVVGMHRRHRLATTQPRDGPELFTVEETPSLQSTSLSTLNKRSSLPVMPKDPDEYLVHTKLPRLALTQPMAA